VTIIAYDGKTLAADRMCMRGDTISTVTKLWFNGEHEAIAVSGNFAVGAQMRRWYEGSRDVAGPEWPTPNDKLEHTVMVVADELGARYYESGGPPEPIEVCEKFAAWGVGREAALGAMAMGADARRAVEIASEWVMGCGRGVDYVHVCIK